MMPLTLSRRFIHGWYVLLCSLMPKAREEEEEEVRLATRKEQTLGLLKPSKKRDQ
jgi:hypothetical protein